MSNAEISGHNLRVNSLEIYSILYYSFHLHFAISSFEFCNFAISKILKNKINNFSLEITLKIFTLTLILPLKSHAFTEQIFHL